MPDRRGPRLAVTARFRTDVGCLRQVNEDSLGFFNPRGGRLLTGPGVVAVIADGMGGHSAGELASRVATEVVGRVYFESDGSPRDALLTAFAEANREIFRLASQGPDQEGMGTTCSALALRDDSAWTAHVGDSRIYLLRDGDLFAMTEDDSMVQDLVRRGLLRAEEARDHAERNVILRALGTQPELTATAWEQPFAVRAGDVFVLSTDGLHDLLNEDEIGEIVAAADPNAACRRLIEEARERGAPDNVTVGVVALSAADEIRDANPSETREVVVDG